MRSMLQQPVKPTGRTDKQQVLRIRGDELHVCQAGVCQKDQAKIQNLKTFMEWEEERQ